MTKAKLVKLLKYQSELKDKLANPQTHAKRGNLETYKQFLKNELQTVGVTIETAKENGVK